MAKTKINKKSPIYKFIKIVLSILIPTTLILIVLTFGYLYYMFTQISTADNGVDLDGEETSFLEELFSTGPEKITVAAFGVDKDGMRTDSIIVGTFDTKTEDIDLISVPRDTYIELDDEMYASLNTGDYAPPVMKINELHAYAGEDWYNYVIPVLEDLLGVDINHYVLIDLDIFKEMVDLIEGVDFYVPMDMYYSDPYQNLYINLKEGQQVLDGEQAEMLIRYRYGYSNGDIGRIETQQAFMKAFTEQLIQWAGIFNIDDLINTIYDDLETDLSLGEAINYATKYYDNIDPSNMETHIIPGQAQYIDGRSYYVIDSFEVKNFVDDILHKSEEKEDIESIGDSKDLRIEILNGGSVNGIATTYSNKLEGNGYDIVSVGTYDGNRVEETRIIVSQEGMGEDLVEYFEEAEIINMPVELSPNVDIRIIIGTGEK